MLTPDFYYSFAWVPQFTQQKLQQEQDKELWVPGRQPVPPDPYLVHFSVLRGSEEWSWCWLFPHIAQPLRLRAMLDLLSPDPNLDPVRAAMPPRQTIVVEVDPAWLATAEGIQEVWIGFNYQRYYLDRNLRQAAEAILLFEEFQVAIRR